MRQLIKRLMGNARGATAVEYGLIAALIAIASLGAIQTFANGTMRVWNSVSDAATKNL